MRTLNNITSYLLFFTFLLSVSSSQMIYLKGKTIDAETGNPLAGTNIKIEKSETGTISNSNGNFTLFVDSLPAVLVFKYIGYEELKYIVDTESEILAQLRPSVLEMNIINVKGRSADTDKLSVSGSESLSLRNMEYSGFIDGYDILNDFSGFYLSNTNTGNQTIRIRGSDRSTVAVYFDGVKLNNSFNREANISNIDINMLESVSVIKSGISSMHGHGNLGGVVYLNSYTPEKTYLKIKSNYGITDEYDKDQIVEGGLGISKFGMNYYKSLKRRQYDGVNSKNHYITSGSAGYYTKKAKLWYKHISMIDQLEMITDVSNSPKSYIQQGDSLVIDQITFTGSLPYSNGWYIKIGRRNYIKSNYPQGPARAIVDSTVFFTVSKKYTFNNIYLIGQYENESTRYYGIELNSENSGWKDDYDYRQNDHGWAGLVRINSSDKVSELDSLWFELGMRKSSLNTELQSVVQYKDNLNSITSDTLNTSVIYPLSTLSLGMKTFKKTGPTTSEFYINQGFSLNAPSLLQQKLWYNGRLKLIDEEVEIRSILSGWVHEDSVRLLNDRLENNLLEQFLYPDTIYSEQLSATEAGYYMFRQFSEGILTKYDLSLSVFYKKFTNKLTWRHFGQSVITPDNIRKGAIYGFEVSGGLTFSNIKLTGNYSFAKPSMDILVQTFPNSTLNVKAMYYSRYFSVNVTHMYLSRIEVFYNETDIEKLPEKESTNISFVVTYPYKKFNFMVAYSIHNIFNDDVPNIELNNWTSDFNYFDIHRKFFTFKLNINL